MKLETFRRNEHISKTMQGYCCIRNEQSPLRTIHTHENWFEFFVCIQGSANHLVNGQLQAITEGTIVFVRPRDIHAYTDPFINNFQIINFAVDSCIVIDALDYLQLGNRTDDIFESTLPPISEVSKRELNILKTKLEHLMFIVRQETLEARSAVRILFIEILTNYFLLPQIYLKPNVPEWIELLIDEMHMRDNYTKGIDVMSDITKKSYSHIAREIKKYLDKTPTQIVNEIRLEEAARQLTYTNNKVIDICGNVGFENLSHFNHEFKKAYTLSPLKFRACTRRL